MSTVVHVPSDGLLEDAKYILIGEQPGRTEMRVGKPFSGPAGKVLDECLNAVGISRFECYKTNVIKTLDKPLEHYITQSRSGISVSSDGQFFFRLLDEEIQKAPKDAVFVLLGNVALYAVAQRWGITKWRGSPIHPVGLTQWAVPVIHPATVLPPKRVYKNKLLIQHDLLRAKNLREGDLVPQQPVVKWLLTEQEVLNALSELYADGLNGIPVDYDIEIHNMEVSCISFTTKDNFAYVIPFLNERGDIFSPQAETEIWIRIAQLLEDSRVAKRGQNITFDSHFLLRKYGIKIAGQLDDTMVMQNTLMMDYPKGLDFITSIWTTLPYYKDDGKNFFRQGGKWETLWQYNGSDSIACRTAAPKQLEALQKQDNLPAYRRSAKLIPILTYMQEHGIRVDVDGMVKEFHRLKEEEVRLLDELSSMAGFALNPNSPKQLKEYLYGKLGYKPYVNRKTGGESTDNIAMKRLKRLGVKEAGLILRIRKVRKITGTYIPLNEDGWPKKVDLDGRIRCSYNPSGTKFSRLSSSENIFETGMNMQNWPHDLRRFLLADEGYIFYSPDLSQAENRIVAYVGNIGPMIECFETGKDVHKLTAALIFQKPVDEISNVDGSSKLGDGTQSERFWGKKANHGLNYDYGYRSFAILYEIPEKEAKWIVDRYHAAYPGVRLGYHAYVKSLLLSNRTVLNLMGRKTKFLDEWGDSLFKEAYSCIPQGTVGDVINERGLEFIYYSEDSDFAPVELLTQTHDDIAFQVPVTTPWIQHARILRKLRASLETPLTTHYGREFVIPSDISIGLNMHKESGAELKAKKFPKTDEELARFLKETYHQLTTKELTKTADRTMWS